MRTLYRLIAVAATAIIAAPFTALAAGAPHNIRGTLTAVSSTSITVATAAGSQTIALGPKTAIVGVVPATQAEITPGTFIGAANVGSNARSRALEVVVFPKSMAGVGEGDYPWDLPAGGHGSMMTNGTVGTGAGSMMTNGTVHSAGGTAAKTVTLAYKGGTKAMTIPATAPVVRIVPGSAASLAKGAHVFVIPGSGGAPAAFVVVGQQGAVPPM